VSHANLTNIAVRDAGWPSSESTPSPNMIELSPNARNAGARRCPPYRVVSR
jgi:hypothetical protein